jgi:hypothetical protein
MISKGLKAAAETTKPAAEAGDTASAVPSEKGKANSIK